MKKMKQASLSSEPSSPTAVTPQHPRPIGWTRSAEGVSSSPATPQETPRPASSSYFYRNGNIMSNESLAPSIRSSKPIKPRRAHPATLISAWAIPVLVLGQFAFLAVVPVAIALISALRDARSKALRWWVGALTLTYTAPFVIWIVRPDRAQSLSKDISPFFVGLIVVASLALLARIYTRQKR